eukprot:s2767_g3.t1
MHLSRHDPSKPEDEKDLRERLKAAALWAELPVQHLQDECKEWGVLPASSDRSVAMSCYLGTGLNESVVIAKRDLDFCGKKELPAAAFMARRAAGSLLLVLAAVLGAEVAWIPAAQLSSARCSRPQPTGARSSKDRVESGAPAKAAGACAGALLAVLMLLAPAAKAAVNPEYPDGNPVAKDLRLESLPEEEVKRRRTAPREELKVEKWYKQGQRMFQANCSGCHPTSSLVSPRIQDQLLTKEYFSKRGGIDEFRIQYNIRYGAGLMPGFAADCGDLNDNFAATCATVVPLSEEKLRDVQDYVYNRINTEPCLQQLALAGALTPSQVALWEERGADSLDVRCTVAHNPLACSQRERLELVSRLQSLEQKDGQELREAYREASGLPPEAWCEE